MTPDDLTPEQVQLLIDLANADVAEHRANFAVIVSRVGTARGDAHARAVIEEGAALQGIRHAELRRKWIDVTKATA